jgi:formate dehydrogenase subunit delta
MDVQHLIQMANRIGEFFVAMPDHAEAVDGIAAHLQKFWEPRMRRQLLDWLDDCSSEHENGLHPLVDQAIKQHRSELDPR